MLPGPGFSGFCWLCEWTDQQAIRTKIETVFDPVNIEMHPVVIGTRGLSTSLFSEPPRLVQPQYTCNLPDSKT